jgi:hypothetical protein
MLDAIDYTITHDDGTNLSDLAGADLVLCGGGLYQVKWGLPIACKLLGFTPELLLYSFFLFSPFWLALLSHTDTHYKVRNWS